MMQKTLDYYVSVYEDVLQGTGNQSKYFDDYGSATEYAKQFPDYDVAIMKRNNFGTYDMYFPIDGPAEMIDVV